MRLHYHPDCDREPPVRMFAFDGTCYCRTKTNEDKNKCTRYRIPECPYDNWEDRDAFEYKAKMETYKTEMCSTPLVEENGKFSSKMKIGCGIGKANEIHDTLLKKLDDISGLALKVMSFMAVSNVDDVRMNNTVDVWCSDVYRSGLMVAVTSDGHIYKN